MRKSAFLLGVVVFLAGTAGAQTRLENPAAPNPSAADGAAISQGISQQGSAPQLFALAGDPSSNGSSGAAAAEASSASSPSAASSPAPASPLPAQGPTTQDGGVQSVFAQYNWQGYAGYTYTRFYEGDGFDKNLNGFNVAVDYFHHAGHLGVEGEGVLLFGSQSNHTAELWAGMGGGRYRFAAPRGLEVWVHGLVGGAKFVPQTAIGNGSETGFAYEAGAGVDIGGWNKRIAFRLSGDMLGTHFFGQNQFNPKVSAGIVFKY